VRRLRHRRLGGAGGRRDAGATGRPAELAQRRKRAEELPRDVSDVVHVEPGRAGPDPVVQTMRHVLHHDAEACLAAARHGRNRRRHHLDLLRCGPVHLFPGCGPVWSGSSGRPAGTSRRGGWGSGDSGRDRHAPSRRGGRLASGGHVCPDRHAPRRRGGRLASGGHVCPDELWRRLGGGPRPHGDGELERPLRANYAREGRGETQERVLLPRPRLAGLACPTDLDGDGPQPRLVPTPRDQAVCTFAFKRENGVARVQHVADGHRERRREGPARHRPRRRDRSFPPEPRPRPFFFRRALGLYLRGGALDPGSGSGCSGV
jgi:hypothetical protein